MNTRKSALSFYLLFTVLVEFLTPSMGREMLPSSETNHVYEEIRKMAVAAIKDAGHVMRKGVKFQKPVPQGRSFPCDTKPGAPGARSAIRPSSAHLVRPGDIDVVGAMGDSVMAGNGAASSNIFQAYVENRGLSFAIGGEATWRKHLTLPNILKEFNPNLVGYSLGDSLGFMNDSKFNVAEPMAMNRDLVFQAELLTRRMKADKRVNFYKDWKLVTVMMGHNDFCSDMCYGNWSALPGNTRKDLQAALDYFRDNMPRSLINLVPPLNVRLVNTITNPPALCHLFYRVACSCFFGPRGRHLHEELEKIIKRSQEVYFEIVKRARYNDKEDFAVVVQPFLINASFPTKTVNGRNVTDYSVFASDCFHLSQKGHAIVANTLWNSMLEPVGEKQFVMSSELFKQFLCPTTEHPYIFTPRNSDMQHDVSTTPFYVSDKATSVQEDLTSTISNLEIELTTNNDILR